MKVNKLKQVLFDSSMQQRDLTTELKPISNHGGNNHNGRKLGSKNKMTLKSLDKKLDLSIKSLDSKLDKLADTVLNLAKEMRKGFNQVNSRIDKLESRIDNLVAKNNLKE